MSTPQRPNAGRGIGSNQHADKPPETSAVSADTVAAGKAVGAAADTDPFASDEPEVTWDDLGVGVMRHHWTKNGFAPADAKEWLDTGASPRVAGDWRLHGFTPTEADDWRMIRGDLRHGARTAREWCNQDFTADEAGEWIEASLQSHRLISAEEAAAFRPYVDNAAEAMELRNKGMIPDDARKKSESE